VQHVTSCTFQNGSVAVLMEACMFTAKTV